ncbi:MAG TPA: alpha/beta fold hydrolase [Solirubrobacteraceae bacterium]|jgi:pimeloyl-ACP methyl ester carboxylesterase|nr:alpha/beta fold hydrolase [Solirubrobacteraceae bacterium]
MVEQVEQVRVEADGLTFATLRWGPAEGPLALCLHGYPDTAWTFRRLGPYLAERGWRVVAPFSRGYAPTDLAPDDCYQVGALAHDAIALHEALGGDERAVLIGHDWGGLAATTVAAYRPELFARIVSLAVAPTSGFLGALLSPAGAGQLPAQLRRSWYIGFQQLSGVSERRLPSVIGATVVGLVAGLRRLGGPSAGGRGDERPRPAPGRAALVPRSAAALAVVTAIHGR